LYFYEKIEIIMSKLGLIFKREYLSRVSKKSFILATLLTPIGFGLLIFVSGYLQVYEGDKQKNFVIVDDSDYLHDSIGTHKGYQFSFSSRDIETEKAALPSSDNTGIVHLQKGIDLNQKSLNLKIFTEEKISFEVRDNIENLIESRLESHKMAAKGIDQTQLEALSIKVKLDAESVKEGKQGESSLGAVISTILGAVMGIVMYFVLFMYGMMVMQGVQEEKTSRIVEVIISSVKPFELMLGKILGVAAVGLTQISIWAILMVVVSSVVTKLLGFSPDQSMQMNGTAQQAIAEGKGAEMANIIAELGKVNWMMIVPLFLIYFVFGYLMYASLYAAVGSALGDDPSAGQSMSLPLSLPIILAVYISMHAIKQPDSTLSVFASIFPLFSPIVMTARLGYNPPMWQIVTSISVLIISTICFIWLAGRIYRVGIMLYGKKASWREFGRWIFTLA
jgi:ABC-2 type transport system permease protein